MNKKPLFNIILFVLLFLLIETVSFAACKFLQRRGIIYKPVYDKNGYAAYLEKRDTLLGWLAPKYWGCENSTDSSGSRVIPAFPNPLENTSRISLYGDSFTWGAEVDDQHAWGNVLSIMIHARVSNFGVIGYGTDQSFLRFRNNTGDKSKIVFLNHLSENIIRNVNQYRQLLCVTEGVGFKPRFIVRGDSLVLIPLPAFSETEYPDAVYHPEKMFPCEYFLPDGPSGIRKLSFPFTWTALNCFRNFYLQGKLTGIPCYTPFYDRRNASRAFEVTAAILSRFHDEALNREKVPVITVIPIGLDLDYYRRTGSWTYQPLLDEMQRRNIKVLNFGEEIIQRLNGEDIASLCKEGIWSHFNEKGNALLAQIAFEYLQANGLFSVLDND